MLPIRPILASCAALALITGCGGSGSNAPGATPSPTPTDNGVASLPAAQILSRAQGALKKAPSVHLKGTVTTDGQRLTLDLRSSDKGGRGTLTQSGQTIEVLRIGSTVYIKANAEFWRAQTGGNAAATELLKGKYLKGPISDPKMASIAQLTQIDQYTKELLSPKGTVTKGQRKTVRGTEAIAITVAGKDGGTLYVATRGEPYPLQITSDSPSEPGTIDFLDFGAPVTLNAPPENQVVDTSKLGGSG
jgi:hypothetical protein